VVLYFYLSKDGKGEAFKPWKVAGMVSEAANAPVYGISDTYFGSGIVGGALLSLKAIGRKTGEMGLRILKGENPADIPISAEGTTLNMFDWRQLKRWGINESDLPEGSIIRYKEWSFWDLYRWYIIGGIVLLFFQAIIIVGLVAQRKKSKQTEKALQQSKEFNTSVLLSLQDHIVVLDREGNIMDVNESLTQFARENDATTLNRIGQGVNYFEVCRQSSDMGENTARAAVDGIRTILEGSRKRFDMEYPCDSPTEQRWFHMEVLSFQGRKGGVIVTHSDITERKTAEIELRDSENRYRVFVKNSTEAIWCLEFDRIIDIDIPEDEQFDLFVKHAYIAEANDAYARNVGLEYGKELVGTRLVDFISLSNPQNVATIKTLIRKRYIITNAETVESYKEGIARVFLNNSSSIIEAGRLVRVWGTAIDITDKKVLEEKLTKAEQMYRTVADFTYDWEYWRAQDGRMLYISPSCERISGYPSSDFVDHPELVESIILPEDLAVWNAHGHGTDAGPVGSDCQFRIRAKDGTTRWIDHVCRPVYDEQGNYAGVRASNRDITSLRLAEREASKNQEALAHLNRTANLEQLAGSIAHELNQPLTGILSNAQAGELLLKRGDGNRAEIEEILTDIIADSKRSGEILRNLRDFFGRQKVEYMLLGVNAIVEETIRLLNSEFVTQNMTVNLDLSDTLPDVMGNKIQLQQVLINLINNAIQAMQNVAEADRTITVITAIGNESEVQVDVEDTGPGIDPEQIEGIFEPLTTLSPGGLGMGLSISRSIVQAHDGGRIWAENIPSGGARISFTLPVLKRNHD